MQHLNLPPGIIKGQDPTTVTNISASRVSGIFSGKEKKAEAQGVAEDEFTITDGKFDIPVKNGCELRRFDEV